jgi:dihydrofolate reductase
MSGFEPAVLLRPWSGGGEEVTRSRKNFFVEDVEAARVVPTSGRGKEKQMLIRSRMSMSADGYVTTPSGWPALTADPAFVPAETHGFPEFRQNLEAALMGRTTFEPALGNDFWPWPGLQVFVLTSHRPVGTPHHVVTDSDPARLLARIREANRGGDVHLVGGPRTIETFRALGALDRIELVVLPMLFGTGMQLTPALSPDTGLAYESQRALPGGSVEIVYSVSGQREPLSAHHIREVAAQARMRRGE